MAVKEFDVPSPKANEVLVKIHAVSLNVSTALPSEPKDNSN